MLRTTRSSAAHVWKICSAFDGRAPPLHRMSFHSIAQPMMRSSDGCLGTAKGTTTTKLSSIRRRTFFTDHSNGAEQLETSSAQFTPLQEFLLDVSAWMLAITLWYAPRIEFDDDILGENQDGNLEYREDYGPCLSSSQSSSTSTSKSDRRNPKNTNEKKSDKDV